MSNWIAAMVLLLCAPSWAAAPGANPMEEKRLQVLKMLKTQKYFKFSTCSEIASSVLQKNGLPVLGKTKPVKGQRGRFTRSAKPKDPPVFRDEITPKGSEKIKVHIQALSPNSKRWSLHLNRSGKIQLKEGLTPVSMDTVLDFNRVTHGSHKTCELSGITFKLNNKPSDESLKPEQVTIRECIDLFMVNPGTPSLEMKWIRADCALALHYSTEAKKAVGLDPHGK